MSEALQSLQRKIEGAEQLRSVVRTMKTLASVSIGQYERAVVALSDYYRTVELGLVACLRQEQPVSIRAVSHRPQTDRAGAVVFGSDQGLVGQFNDDLATFVASELGPDKEQAIVWAVGERISSSLDGAGIPVAKLFLVPNSVSAITPLVGEVLLEAEGHREKGDITQVYLFHNRPMSGASYEPAVQRLLPLDESWRRRLHDIRWPSRDLPETVGDRAAALTALIREYLFVSLFKSCAESLASENASRLAAMRRAEKNIQDLAEDLTRSFQRQRQSSIDEELFDVFSGFSALEHRR